MSSSIKLGQPARDVGAGTRFHLDGPSHSFDPRTDAIRPDLADYALAARYFAPHYAAPVLRSVTADRLALHKDADRNSEQVSELLAGEGFALLDDANGWGWGYCLHDHYVGYVQTSGLGEYVAPIAPAIAADPIATAEAMVDTPYLWGGRSAAGIDCSGLVQQTMAHAGVAVRRDADQQMDSLAGTAVAADAPLMRGDVVFFPHHVGMMVDDRRIVHATRHWGKVVIEPLADVVARMAAKGHEPAVLKITRPATKG